MNKTLLALTLSVSALVAAPALAEVIELADGRTIQGEVLSGQTTEEGLALRMFETGGVVVVRWDHVLPERAKQLRVEYGIDIPEDESVVVPGHTVTLTNGTQVTGVAENADAFESGAESTLRLKTPTGVQTYDKQAVARVDRLDIEALEAYTQDELYQLKVAENPPDSAAAHFALADFCSRIGDYVHAKEHYEAAKADADFLATNDGKSLDARLRRVEILIRAAGAQDLALAIQRAMFQRNWNLALEKLNELDSEYEDPQIRDAIGFGRLESRVVRGRDDFFKKRVANLAYDVMERLIRDKARERKPRRATDEDTMSGTLAGARQWTVRELPTELWDKVGADLGLEKDEIDRFWTDRSVKRVRTATYGTGSFIVIKRATLPGGDNRRRRLPPGARRGQNNAGGGGGSASKPKSDEEWFEAVSAGDRAKWLEAYFVENSGIFEIIRTDESDLCSNCAGKGFLASVGSDGSENQSYCPQCNGSGKFRQVMYR